MVAWRVIVAGAEQPLRNKESASNFGARLGLHRGLAHLQGGGWRCCARRSQDRLGGLGLEEEVVDGSRNGHNGSTLKER